MKTIFACITIITLGLVYLAWRLPDLMQLLNFITITKGNVIYYLHFNQPMGVPGSVGQ